MKLRWYWYGAVVLILAGVLGWVVVLRSPSRGLPYRDAFKSGSSEEWTAYGGTWRSEAGAMRNESDERGAKLMTGSYYWRDYTVTTDIELLGEQGDAGVVMRSTDEEQGVDSYSGYYAGLRSNDGNLVIGIALHGWIQLTQQPMPGGVHPFHWYRLQVSVAGCRVTAVAVDIATGNMRSASIDDQRYCLQQGRVGLRSHSSGGVWRDFSVRRLQAADNAQDIAASPLAKFPTLHYEIDEPVLDHRDDSRAAEAQIAASPQAPRPVDTIASLKLVTTPARQAIIRGTVVLTSPALYVQDATGGAAILGDHLPQLKLGDEVEVRGITDIHDFSLSLRNAAVRTLWARAPLPPLSITASQAATGAYDAMFIEVDGMLASHVTTPDGSLQLEMTSNGQSFRAIADPGRNSAFLRGLARQSHLRLRGVCVVDPAFTHNLNPFVLLVPSGDDLEVLAGPPWWSARNLAMIGFGVIIVLLIAALLYIRVDHWRLHAVLDERERIAHEMHDSLAQSFVGIGFQLQAIGNGLPRELPEVHSQLDLACELVRHSHEEARRSLLTLRREFLESETLHAALGAFARRIVEHGMVEVRVENSGEEGTLPYTVKDALFRIGQEAVANSIRHAAPTLLCIRVDYDAAAVTLTVDDNGEGFVPAEDARGFGLGGMRKRAESVAARLEIASIPGQGTTVRVAVPVPPRLSVLSAVRYVRHFGDWRREHAERNGKQDPYSYR